MVSYTLHQIFHYFCLNVISFFHLAYLFIIHLNIGISCVYA
jgi:hypothetical protein